jgi:pantothenate kinase-related protein Tda10
LFRNTPFFGNSDRYILIVFLGQVLLDLLLNHHQQIKQIHVLLNPCIIMNTGNMASGKSTVAQALAERLAKIVRLH